MKKVHSVGSLLRVIETFAVVGGVLCLARISKAEIPADLWSNPVLASGDGVIGPLMEGAKTTTKIIFDYSALTAVVTVQDYTEIHKTTLGTLPFQTVSTTTQHHFVDPSDGKQSIWESYTTYMDQNGKITVSPTSNSTFKHGLGNATWKCSNIAPDGSLIARSELFVLPTRIKIRVDVAKYANYNVKFPSRVMLWLDAGTTILADCDLGGVVGEWSRQTSVTPGIDYYVIFDGKNMIADYLPSIQIGYARGVK